MENETAQVSVEVIILKKIIKRIMGKILTVIIPTYNMEQYLRKCLDSLLCEGKEKMEVLVINDGSKDSSSAIAHEYESRYPETFRVIDKENGNYGSCINRGLKEATGKYVKILDADDMFESGSLGKFLSLLETVDAELILSDFYTFRAESNKILQSFSFPNDKIFPAHEIFVTKRFVPMHAITYKRSIFNRFDYHQTEGISYTDMQWNSIPLLYVQTVYYSKLPIYFYRLGREGQTVDLNVKAKKIDDEILCAEDMIRFLNSAAHLSDESINYFKERCYERCINVYSFVIIEQNHAFRSLEAFDFFLKENNHEIFTKLEDAFINPYIKFRYIIHWRKTHRGLPVRVRLLLHLVKVLSFSTVHHRILRIISVIVRHQLFARSEIHH